MIGMIKIKENYKYGWKDIFCFLEEFEKHTLIMSYYVFRHVITAAHCLIDDELELRLGEYDLTKSDSGIYATRNHSKMIHDKYEELANRAQIYDTAILELKTPVDFEKYPNIRPICLPDTNDKV